MNLAIFQSFIALQVGSPLFSVVMQCSLALCWQFRAVCRFRL